MLLLLTFLGCDIPKAPDVADTAPADTDTAPGTDTDTEVHCGDLGDPSADCDDGNADVGPECPELCNGIDDNCDEQIDEGVTTRFHADADDDGAGDRATFTDACEAPDGYVVDGSDCDDTDPATHPAALEVCGGTDEDCDGTTDEPDAVDALTWYADTDGDGYGDAAVAMLACAQPTGFVADATDADDTNPAVY